MGLLALLATQVAACADDPIRAASEPCSPGTRVCDGQTVLLCSAAVETFVVERECPTGTTCAAGECRPSFTGGEQPTDTVTSPDAGAGVPDAGGDLPDTHDAAGLDGGPGDGTPQDGVTDTTDTPDLTDAEQQDAGPEDVGEPLDTPATPDVPAPQDVPQPIDTPSPEDTPSLDVHDTPDIQEPVDVPVQPDIQPPKPCGNGKLDPGETCDPGILAGEGSCPQTCYDPPGCAILLLQGDPSTCDAVCVKILVSEPIPGDDCCPPGATGATDPDCASECGNGKKEGAEECDSADLGGATCGFSGVLPSCLKNCTLSTLPCPGKHLLLYERVKNLQVKGDLHTVRWHPSGEFALILSGGGDVIRYDAATHELLIVANIYGAADLDVHPTGEYFLIVGSDKSKVAHVWRATVAPDLSVTLTDAGTLSNGNPAAIIWSDWQETWIIGTRNDSPSNPINWLYLWKDGETPKLKGYNAPGIVDLMVGPSAAYFDELTVFTSDGVNGTKSTAYILSTDEFVPSGWPNGFGNPGTAAWRPGGTYGMFTAWTAGKLYVYNGSSWSNVPLPNTPSGAGPNGIGWKPDGSRALIVGNAIGTPIHAAIVDHRPAGKVAFDATAFVDQSIYGWDTPPYSLNSSADPLDVDWRPVDCDEGLIVGSDPGTSWDPSYGIIIRFWDQDDPDCQ